MKRRNKSGAFFNTINYLDSYDDIKITKINPLLHNEILGKNGMM